MRQTKKINLDQELWSEIEQNIGTRSIECFVRDCVVSRLRILRKKNLRRRQLPLDFFFEFGLGGKSK